MIKLNNLSLDFAGNIIFKNISLQVKKTDKIGLIGNNGAGKTTLLNLLAKKILPTTGSISQDKDLKISYLPQELYFNSDISLKEFVVGDNSELIRLNKQIDKINNMLSEVQSQKKQFISAGDVYDGKFEKNFFENVQIVHKGVGPQVHKIGFDKSKDTYVGCGIMALLKQ